MIDSLSLTITLACLLVALAALVATVAGRFRVGRFTGAFAVVEVALVLQAMLAAIALLRGHRLAETPTFVAYLVFSVLVLPVVAAQLRGTAGRWAGAVLIAGFLVVALVEVRAQTTWRA